MLFPRILAPVRASISIPAASKLAVPSKHVLDALRTANGATTCSPTMALSFIRHASHQSQGRANGAKQGPGKRLGAKKSGGEYVIPGNIIFRQRGTGWFPGENCKFGRDHCIFATESGYVRYYKDPRRHPKRQYIGVALQKEHSLPYPVNIARPRRLNRVAVTTTPEPTVVVAEGTSDPEVIVAATQAESQAIPADKNARVLTMGRGYGFREANWQIGRAAERANVQVKQFVPGDRWTAWKRSQARIQANEEKKRLRNSAKKGKTDKAKKQRARKTA